MRQRNQAVCTFKHVAEWPRVLVCLMCAASIQPNSQLLLLLLLSTFSLTCMKQACLFFLSLMSIVG